MKIRNNKIEKLNGRIFNVQKQLYEFSDGSGKITTEEVFEGEQRQVHFDLNWLKLIKMGKSRITAYYLTVLSRFKTANYYNLK